MSNKHAIRVGSESPSIQAAPDPIHALTIEHRRSEVLVLTAAHRAALAAYRQHVEESIEPRSPRR